MAEACPVPLDCSETHGELTIDGQSLHLGAWCAYDLSTILQPATVREQNVPVESVTIVPRPVVRDTVERTLPMLFSGAVDRAGVSWSEPFGGLERNRREFVSLILDPIRNGSASLPATIEVPDGDGGTEILEATVQPLTLSWSLLAGGYARAALSLRIVEGEFTNGGEGE